MWEPTFRIHEGPRGDPSSKCMETHDRWTNSLHIRGKPLSTLTINIHRHPGIYYSWKLLWLRHSYTLSLKNWLIHRSGISWHPTKLIYRSSLFCRKKNFPKTCATVSKIVLRKTLIWPFIVLVEYNTLKRLIVLQLFRRAQIKKLLIVSNRSIS
jgi:hypothetical protein